MESLQLNWLDYVIIGIVLLSTIGGALRGLLKEVLPLVSLVLGLLIAYRVSPSLHPYADEWLRNDTMAYVFCFVLVFALAWIALGLLSGLLYKLVKATAAGPLDKLFGAVLGIVRGVVVAVIIVVAVLAFLPPGHSALQDSSLAPSTLYIGQLAWSIMPDDARAELERRYEKLKEKADALRRGHGRIDPNSI